MIEYICNNSEKCNSINCKHRIPHFVFSKCYKEIRCATTLKLVKCVPVIKQEDFISEEEFMI